MGFPICHSDANGEPEPFTPTEEHSVGEVYCYHTLDKATSMYELECHDGAVTLKKGESTSTTITLFIAGANGFVNKND